MAIYLHMIAWEGRSSKCFLCLIHHFPFWYAQNKSGLIRSSCSRSYSITTLPSLMDTFTGIKEIQFYYLITRENP